MALTCKCCNRPGKLDTLRKPENPLRAVCPLGEVSPGKAGEPSNSQGSVHRCSHRVTEKPKKERTALGFVRGGWVIMAHQRKGVTQGGAQNLGVPVQQTTARYTLRRGKPEAAEQQV